MTANYQLICITLDHKRWSCGYLTLLVMGEEAKEAENMTIRELAKSRFVVRFIGYEPHAGGKTPKYAHGSPAIIKQGNFYWTEVGPRLFQFHNDCSLEIEGGNFKTTLRIDLDGYLVGKRANIGCDTGSLVWMAIASEQWGDNAIIALDVDGDWYRIKYKENRPSKYDKHDYGYIIEEMDWFDVGPAKRKCYYPTSDRVSTQNAFMVRGIRVYCCDLLVNPENNKGDQLVFASNYELDEFTCENEWFIVVPFEYDELNWVAANALRYTICVKLSGFFITKVVAEKRDPCDCHSLLTEDSPGKFVVQTETDEGKPGLTFEFSVDFANIDCEIRGAKSIYPKKAV